LEDNFPSHVVCYWMGNSKAVAKKHYLQVTEEHLARALRPDETKDLHSHTREAQEVSQNQSQQLAASVSNVLHADTGMSGMTPCVGNLVTPTGLEPVLPA
jgi:hypothetical protein